MIMDPTKQGMILYLLLIPKSLEVPSGTVRVRRAGAERDHGQNAGGFHRAQHGRTAALWVRAFQCGRKCRCGKINRFPAQNRNDREPKAGTERS